MIRRSKMKNAKPSSEIETMKMLSDVGRHAAQENAPVFARVDGKELVIMTPDAYADLLDAKQAESTRAMTDAEIESSFLMD
jgi:hypothetical protein